MKYIAYLIVFIALAFIVYRLFFNPKLETVIRGAVIEVPVHVPPVFIDKPGKPYPVKDTTEYQKHLDSLLKEQKCKEQLAQTSEPFAVTGENDTLSYLIIANPALWDRTIQAVFTYKPFKQQIKIMDTTIFVNSSDPFIKILFDAHYSMTLKKPTFEIRTPITIMDQKLYLTPSLSTEGISLGLQYRVY